jgi:hypothetical protein
MSTELIQGRSGVLVDVSENKSAENIVVALGPLGGRLGSSFAFHVVNCLIGLSEFYSGS